jgi:hypothetical protein
MFLVEFLNLTFECEPNRNRDSNVKFAPLARLQPDGATLTRGDLHQLYHVGPSVMVLFSPGTSAQVLAAIDAVSLAGDVGGEIARQEQVESRHVGRLHEAG